MMIVKHETISQILSEEIAGMKPGDRLQTVRELAARFAVSTRTMNKALKPLFSRGLIIADGTRGCFVNSQCKERSGIVGVYAPMSVMRIEEDPLLFPLQELIIRDGYKPLFSNVPDATVFDNERFWRAGGMDGYLFVYSTFNRQLVRWLKESYIPFVSANRLPDDYESSWCDFDHVPVIRSVVGELLKRGYRRIALHNVPHFSNNIDYMIRIWDEVMDHYRIPEAERYPVQGVWQDANRQCQEDIDSHIGCWFDSGIAPEVIIQYSAKVNEMFCTALAKRNLEIGKDVQVVVFSNEKNVPWINVGHVPGAVEVKFSLAYDRLAAELWSLFKQQLDHPGCPPECMELPSEFKICWE